MNVRQLHQLLETMIHNDPAVMHSSVRIGDQIEAGPYEHTPVGGIYRGTDGEVIICADPDAESKEEATGIDHGLPVLWPT